MDAALPQSVGHGRASQGHPESLDHSEGAWGGGREEGISGTYTTATHALRHTPILLFCGCQTVIHLMNCITQIAMVKSPAERENTWMNAQKHCGGRGPEGAGLGGGRGSEGAVGNHVN